MSEPDKHEPDKSDPVIPPLNTIDDNDRIPPPRRPAPPRPRPIKAADDIPAGAIAVAAVIGVAALLIVFTKTIPQGIDWHHHQDWAWFTQWTATVADPVHDYLSAHTVGLPLTASSAFVIWQGVGAASLILSWITGAVGARADLDRTRRQLGVHGVERRPRRRPPRRRRPRGPGLDNRQLLRPARPVPSPADPPAQPQPSGSLI
ncbi:hypothetical protein [Streptomyces sp. NPDC015345]|uniref:hypothetical protein n=1 Tax=Streptomyces sp. NPDC015345 TaxID=3364953 RepID=UPI0036F9FEDC